MSWTLTEMGRAVADELPLFGEGLSIYEGDYIGALWGVIPGSKKIKKALNRLFGRNSKKARTPLEKSRDSYKELIKDHEKKIDEFKKRSYWEL